MSSRGEHVTIDEHRFAEAQNIPKCMMCGPKKRKKKYIKTITKKSAGVVFETGVNWKVEQ